MTDITIIQILTVFIYMNIGFVAAVIKRRNDLADVLWGPGFALLAILGAIFNPTAINLFIAVMVSVWALRLMLHVGARFIKKKEEDYRYQKWRADWGKKWLIKTWIRVFMLQGFLLMMVSLSFILANRLDIGAWSLVQFVGITIFTFGFLFEVIGDWQLKEFIKKKENRGRIMQGGLWRYTRHPNYFGEVVLWWGIWLTTFSTPYFLFGVIGPLTILFLILKVSGIPLLEKKYEGRKEFEEYKKRTNAFFPWFPKNYKATD